MANLGTQFHPLIMLTPSGWVNEPQVKDPEVWDELVRQAMGRCGARYALYSREGAWCVRGPGIEQVREYPNREAAEMIAIHRA